MWVDRATRYLIELMSKDDQRWEALLDHPDPSTLKKYRSTRSFVTRQCNGQAQSQDDSINTSEEDDQSPEKFGTPEKFGNDRKVRSPEKVREFGSGLPKSSGTTESADDQDGVIDLQPNPRDDPHDPGLERRMSLRSSPRKNPSSPHKAQQPLPSQEGQKHYLKILQETYVNSGKATPTKDQKSLHLRKAHGRVQGPLGPPGPPRSQGPQNQTLGQRFYRESSTVMQGLHNDMQLIEEQEPKVREAKKRVKRGVNHVVNLLLQATKLHHGDLYDDELLLAGSPVKRPKQDSK